MPAMVENCFSSGIATELAMVSGLAPGSGDGHQNRRKIDVRKIADRQQTIARDSEKQNRRHDQRGHDRPFDKNLGDVHERFSCTLLEIGLRSLPLA